MVALKKKYSPTKSQPLPEAGENVNNTSLTSLLLEGQERETKKKWNNQQSAIIFIFFCHCN